MAETVLITGGAGFIGRHVAAELKKRGKGVRIIDSLIPQVHGMKPALDPMIGDIDFINADICDGDAVARAVDGVDAIIHLAAEVGVGQSMYEVTRYIAANDLGTGTLFEKLIGQPVRRVVTASSMSIYGEGLYQTTAGDLIEDAARGTLHAGQKNWDPRDDEGEPLRPLPTPEWKRPALQSVYALNKYVQERLTHILAASYGMESVCLRLFNVFGPGQALSNPYTGVLAIFASRFQNGQPPLIFEDGEQRRDFVHVRDVARAFADALDQPGISGETFNIGSGQDRSIREIAAALGAAMGRPDITPEIVGKTRTGDIRHCFADASKARELLDFQPREDFGLGLTEIAEWVREQEAEDHVERARDELERRGLVA